MKEQSITISNWKWIVFPQKSHLISYNSVAISDLVNSTAVCSRKKSLALRNRRYFNYVLRAHYMLGTTLSWSHENESDPVPPLKKFIISPGRNTLLLAASKRLEPVSSRSLKALLPSPPSHGRACPPRPAPVLFASGL